ncbi:type III secretion system inner membrane ring lipoprotein SctJ [Chitinivorax sp. B]|uniref:type III secretion system inner membrane ring lipoprotein SctJ n=1 Tax=Chitinivorax sp. B TaxID=2502235 RepID=UPI0010F6CD20|nr:type III secretion inner membrane ring lipoprotein SctJ [Chitinivorax sp. B]
MNDWQRHPLFQYLPRVLLMVLLLSLTGCSDEVDLQSGLADKEANEIVAVLSNGGVHVRKRALKVGYAVSVSENDIAGAVALMQANGLPRRPADRMGDVFKKEGLISTPLEERARYLYALSQELEVTLGEIDQVVVARVHVVLPERVAPGEPLLPSSAAVFIKHRTGLDPDLVRPRVYQLVSSSIPGLSKSSSNNVSVVFMPADVVPPSVQWVRFGPFDVTVASLPALRWLVGMAGFTLVLLIVSGALLTLNWMKQRNRQVANGEEAAA